MDLLLAVVQAVLRFLAWIGLVDLFQRSEAWIHKRLFPKRLRDAVGDNSDLMHAITILFWMLILSTVLFVIVELEPVVKFVNNFLDIDACLDSGGKWNYEKHACEH